MSQNAPIVKVFSSNRKVERRVIYIGEGIKAHIEFGGLFLKGDVIDITPTGARVAFKDETPLKVADEVKIQIQIIGNESTTLKALVANLEKSKIGLKDSHLVGFSFLADIRKTRPLKSTRVNKRLPVPEHFPATAYCLDAIYFQQFVFFRVEDFSRDGMKLTTSLRNKTLIPGLRFVFKVLIPTQGEFDVIGQVKYVRLDEAKNKLIAGVHVENPSQEYLDAIGEYLFSTQDMSIADVKRAGFPMRRIERGLTFTYPESKEEWDLTLELRRRAYQAVGKFSHVNSDEEMMDQYDAYARHIICKIHNKVVAAGRVVFINGDKKRSEHHNLGIQIPEWIWKENVCEFSRACTDPEYRGADVFINLLRHFGRIAYQGGAKYVIANCNDNMWPSYQKTGFKKLGIRFDAFGTTGCNLIYVDLEDMLSGRSGRFFGWNQVVFPMAKYIESRGGKQLMPRLRSAFHKLIFPLITKLRFSKREKRPQTRA